MNNGKSRSKFEVIEEALQEAVGGGAQPMPACSINCHIFSIDVCHIDLCETRPC